MRRWAFHKDTKHSAIVKALRAIGAQVESINGKDVPDLIVGYRGRVFILEVKTKTERTEKDGYTRTRVGQLSEGQKKWIARWKAVGVEVLVVHDPPEAVEVVTRRAA